MAQFDHEKLDVYRLAIRFVVLARQVVRAFPRGQSYLTDQLQRAALSIVLNIAEGAGEYSKKDKARIYRFALRSATECAAILDVCHALELCSGPSSSAGNEVLVRIASMMTRLIRRSDDQGESA